ncbi:hypothetical protein VPH35_083530 [Triticum aestivum]
MASAAATTPPARGAMPWTVAGSSSPRARRAPSARSSARPAAATAASTTGCRSTRLHGTASPIRRRRLQAAARLLPLPFLSIVKLLLLLLLHHVYSRTPMIVS